MGAALMAVAGTFPQSFCLAVVQEPFCTKDLVGRGSPTAPGRDQVDFKTRVGEKPVSF